MEDVVQKSHNDKCLYRSLTLRNDLRVLLISDPSPDEHNALLEDIKNESGDEVNEEDEKMSCDEFVVSEDCSEKKSKMAAAALCIGVGSFSDPPDLPGLAHFLEHMVFMGSEKYPEENCFDSFISKHGGSDNATTDCENTTYEMEVTPQYLKESLDIFAHCLISPLLKVDSMDKEIEAVHDEFELAMPVDSEKVSMLFGSLAKPGHPMAKFMYGNKKSLKEVPDKKGINLNAALRDFYNQYYFANIMTLAVQSTDSLETLEKYVEEIFSQLPSKNMVPPSFDSFKEPFRTEKFNKLYKITPIKKVHEVILTWALHSLIKQYRSKPLLYISSLIGHEGKGSILSHLKKSALAIRLEAGNDNSGFEMNSTCSTFGIKITLSEYGVEHIPQVLNTVFEYLNMLRKEGPKKYLFEERKLIMEQLFKYKSQCDPIDNVVPLAINMQRFPAEHYLTGNELYFDFDEQLISDCLNCLTPDDVNIFIMSSMYEEDETWNVEPWMECKYTVQEIPSEWKNMWKEDRVPPYLHLPDKNIFIAENFQLIEHETSHQYPVKAFEDENCCLWYKGDVKFKVPKGYAYFHIRSPTWQSSPENSAMTDMFITFLDLVLYDDIYPAATAGLDCEVAASKEGFIIKVSGFNDKLQLFLETVLTCISRYIEYSKFFKSVEDFIRMKYHNCCIKPVKLCSSVSLFMRLKTFWHVLKKKEGIKNLTSEGLNTFVKKCFSTSFVDGLVQGNISKEEATKMIKTVAEMLELECSSEDEHQYVCGLQLPYGESCFRIASFNEEDCHSVVYNYYQLEPQSIGTKCMVDLLLEIMSEPCFDVLRTKYQLGYVVESSGSITCDVLGFFIKIVTPSNKFKCHDVDEHIENFLKNFLNDVQNMEGDDYMTQLESLIEKKKLDDTSLEEEVSRNWSKILLHTYLFDENVKEIEFLEQLDVDVFKTWVKERIMSSCKRKKLAIQVVGHGELTVNGSCADGENDKYNKSTDINSFRYIPSAIINESVNFITDIDCFKQSLSVYPFPNKA